MTIYDLANEQDHNQLYNILLQPKAIPGSGSSGGEWRKMAI